MRRLLGYLNDSARAFRDVYANPALRRLQFAFAGSMLGTWAYGIAVIVYAYEQDGATAVGVLGMARWTAAAIASPFVAILGDRYDRRWVMVGSDLVRAALIGLAAIAVYSDAPSVLVYVLSALVSVSSTAFRPAEAALVPRLAKTPEELTAANVSATTIESIGSFAGPALGGLLLAVQGAASVFVVTAASLLWSAFMIARIPPVEEPPRDKVAGSAIADELLAGVRTIGRDRRLRLVVGLFSMQTLVDGMLSVLIVVLALDLLDTGQAGVGFLNSAIGIGGLIGALGAAALVGRRRLAGDFGVGIFIWGVPLALVAIWPNQAFALVLLGLVGIGNTLVDVSGMTLLQRAAPEDVLARVFGVLESLLLFTTAIGALIAPLLLEWLGTRGALIAAGALLPILVVPAWPRLSAIDRSADVPAERVDAVRANPIFAPLQEATLEQLATAIQDVERDAGVEIVRQGESGDQFFLVADGTLDVYVDGEQVGALGAGDSFGEIALLRDVPRTATVKSRTPVRLYALARGSFLAAVTASGPSLSAADGVIGMRLGRGRPAPVQRR
ncbi:MAG: MFS transporter [Gaiellaceae bacterium]